MVLAESVVVVVAVGFLVVGLLGPLVAQLRLRRWREPTADDLDQLGALLDDAPTAFARIVVIETVGEASVEVAIRGPPGYRVLFITDYVLVELDPEVARALVVAERARTSLKYREYQVVAATVAIALGLAAILLVVPFELGFAVLLVVAAVMLAGGRWLQYRADAAAADVVGAGELADAFEAVAGLRGTDLSRGGWRTYLEVQPPLGDRVYRLRSME